jgi:hypothetical protein
LQQSRFVAQLEFVAAQTAVQAPALHVSPFAQPQSLQQFVCVSPLSQIPLPQLAVMTLPQTPAEHDCPLGQPQSVQQVLSLSPAWQTPSPQRPAVVGGDGSAPPPQPPTARQNRIASSMCRIGPSSARRQEQRLCRPTSARCQPLAPASLDDRGRRLADSVHGAMAYNVRSPANR